ncbi:hypothetical protein C1701_18960 [Actinoalloteichus sp. AHMU CJ021]|uniref:Uncharacterized protein n=1 Tax=Actinoalloteichus caeruleus DSM 43889 TaxID=1120930 RepID=A0ABT1JP21_ACTCY|nr:DUF6703 family protein [Actinoalloteichus caeruleus]AUS80072.1 hypothetical protein C1701_18960 [Actinoalloteichus sp. AHMU CJ021]MCP2334266.1 hypothetical protein [Actinoalloteichus caeruleus DSM 43889]
MGGSGGRPRQDRERGPEGPLSRVPPAAAFVGVLAVFLIGVWVGGPLGAALLSVLLLFVLGLIVTRWHQLRPAERVGRVLVVAVLTLVTLSVLVPALP